MLRCLIIDDIKNSREALEQMLALQCPQVQVVGMAASAKEGYEQAIAQKPNLVFLDVEMPGGSGFKFLERFKTPPFEVIFTTAHNHYALRAIKFSALDYLLKPINLKELAAAVQKTEQKYLQNQSHDHLINLIQNLKHTNTKELKIAIPTQEGFIFLPTQDIIRCEADGSYTKLFLANKKMILATKKLKSFEHLLTEYDFFRIHRSHLINMSRIEKYYKGEGGYVVMTDGSSIAVARRKKEAFLERLK